MSSPPHSLTPTMQSLVTSNEQLKRRIAELEDLAQASHKETEEKSFSHKGRAINKIISLYEPIDDLISENDRRQELIERALDGDIVEEVDPTPEQAHNFRGYAELIQHMPFIKTILEGTQLGDSSKILAELRRGGNGARADNTNSLREVLPSWMPDASPPLNAKYRSNRGLHHDETGRLLCPIEYDWDDLSIRSKICDGHINFPVTAYSWPSFLYPNTTCDLENIEKDIFRSPWLIKAYKFVFTSPTSAMFTSIEGDEDTHTLLHAEKRRKTAVTKRSVSSIIGLHSVTPRSIAYVASQFRFTLSDAPSWTSKDGAFGYQEFYNNIVDYFECPPGPIAKAECKDILRWWNEQIFPSAASHVDDAHRANLSVSKSAAQHAAREIQ